MGVSINPDQLRDAITRTLKKVPGFYSENAVTLLMMTCAVESNLGYYAFHQIKGPAKGIMQVEPETMRDHFGNYLFFRDRLKAYIRVACGVDCYDINALEFNVAFNILMARLKYWRDSEPIPSTLEGMAHYHEKVYNAHPGNYAGTGLKDWQVTLKKYYELVVDC